MKRAHKVSLADLTTLRVGGFAREVITVEHVSDIAEAIAYATSQNLPWRCLGGGSNMLASDEGFDGVVIKIELRGIDDIRLSSVEAIVETGDGYVDVRFAAGESWDACVAWAVSHGYWGIENLSAIPGTVGATPVQNVGAYGVEVSDVITCVEVIDTHTLQPRTLSREECGFAYRTSVFKREEGAHYIITSVVMRLRTHATPAIEYKDLAQYFAHHTVAPTLAEVRDAVIAIRAQKFPDMSLVGTAGSFFKNPIVSSEEAQRLEQSFPGIPIYPDALGYKVSLAWILDHVCSLKGCRHGSVGLFEKQPLVLVSYEGATARDIDVFASHVEKKVFDATGVRIEREVRDM